MGSKKNRVIAPLLKVCAVFDFRPSVPSSALLQEVQPNMVWYIVVTVFAGQGMSPVTIFSKGNVIVFVASIVPPDVH